MKSFSNFNLCISEDNKDPARICNSFYSLLNVVDSCINYRVYVSLFTFDVRSIRSRPVSDYYAALYKCEWNEIGNRNVCLKL